jgi:hypothetical protein
MKTFDCCHLLLFTGFIIPSKSLDFLGVSTRSVRSLITSHAFGSIIMNEMIHDVVDKPVIIHNIIDLSHPRFNFGLELTTISILSYILYKTYYTSVSSFYEKFKRLPEFKKYYRKFQFCIFILTIVFTKEIENAI